MVRRYRPRFAKSQLRAPYGLLGLGAVVDKGSPLNRAALAPSRKTNTWSFVVSSANSKQFLPKTARLYLKLINTGSNPIYYAFGQPASTTSIALPAGAETEFSVSPSQDTIHAVATVGDSNLMVIEEVA